MKYWMTLTKDTGETLAVKAKYVDFVQDNIGLGCTEIHMLPTVNGMPGKVHYVKESVSVILDKIAQAFVKE